MIAQLLSHSHSRSAFTARPLTVQTSPPTAALDLIGTQAPFTHGCQVLPNTLWTMAIFPYQDDLRTDHLSFTGCNVFPGATCGVFTSVTGTAPNRHFNVEWRAVHFADTTTSANFEVVFSENQSKL